MVGSDVPPAPVLYVGSSATLEEISMVTMPSLVSIGRTRNVTPVSRELVE